MSHVVHICYPGVGGQAAVATGLAKQGMLAGVSQAVVFYGVEPTAQQYIEFCDSAGIAHTTIVKKPGIGLGARKDLLAAIESYQPNVVIAHHHDTCISACLRLFSPDRPKVVFVEHHSNAIKTRKDWVLSALAHKMSAHTVYLTQTYRDVVKEKTGCFFDSRKTCIIPNGLDVDDYETVAPKAPQVIGMQGRMDAGKDFKTLLDAFVKLPGNLSLDLIGDGPTRGALEDYAVMLNVADRVRFTGFLPHADLVSRMRSWDIAVLSTEGETLSMAVLEAWALALPLVGTRVPGVGDLINDGCDGLLANPKSSDSLSEQLQLLVQNKGLRGQLARAGRARVEQEFNRVTVWKKYAQLIRQLTYSDAMTGQEESLDSLP